MLKLHNFREFGKVAFHGKDAVHHNEFHGILGAALDAALQILHVIVLVVQAFGKGETPAVHDGSMVTVVADDKVVLGKELGNHAGIRGKAGGENQGFVLAHKLGQFLFQLDVDV